MPPEEEKIHHKFRLSLDIDVYQELEGTLEEIKNKVQGHFEMMFERDFPSGPGDIVELDWGYNILEMEEITDGSSN